MKVLVAYLTVFAAAAVPWLEVLLVVPAGILAGLAPVPTAVVGFLGNTASLIPLVYGGDRLRTWWRRRRRVEGQVPSGGRSGRARALFDRFGLPGLAVLGPVLTGIHVAALVALAAGADRRRTAFWLTLGVAAWSAVAAVVVSAGLGTLVDPDRLPDLGL